MNPVLFGHDPTPRIVSIDVEPGAEQVRLYVREGSSVTSKTVPFQSFVLLQDRELLKGFHEAVQVDPLAGDHPFAWRAQPRNGVGLENLRKHLQKKTGKTPTAVDAPYLYISDLTHQHLITTGITQFKGMRFDDLVRLQIDIETYCSEGFDFPNPGREVDRIISIALSDNRGWEHVIFGREKGEPEMLEELNRCMVERDPDVIEGHNLFRFDLEYIQARAKRFGIRLVWGRNGSLLESRPSRMQIGERSITFTRFEVFGRHIVDTFILAQHYDIATRELESLGLKEAATHFGIASKDRTYVAPDRISWTYDHDPETLAKYNLDDVRETRALSEILLPGFFVQAQIFPVSFQNTMLRGNAVKIDSLFIREYLHRGHSVPRAKTSEPIQGGYTEIPFQGVIHNVLHCDVTSLYPSVMLVHRLFPKSDVLEVFPRLLGDLRDFRVRAKARAKQAKDPAEQRDANALQSTFKILINSFYGYLGFEMAHFNDYEKANRVTEVGRQTLQSIMKHLTERGARLIEVDTDGIYFVPPPGLDRDGGEALMEEVTRDLPKEIRLELDGRFPAMFSYRMKNYVLLTDRSGLLIKGSGLRSRGIELYQRQWMEEMFLLLLHGKREAIRKLYEDYRGRLERHEMPVKLFMKTETLQESPQSYQDKVRAKKRNVSAAYELALSASRPYQAGDQISYYVIGDSRKVKVYEACRLSGEWNPRHPDENTDFYLAKLEELYEKFRPFFEVGPGQHVVLPD